MPTRPVEYVNNLWCRAEKRESESPLLGGPDYKKFPPKFFKRDDGSYHVRQDFNAGFPEEQLLNLAYQVIRSIADLKDHLRAAARQIGRDPQEVNDVVNSCLPRHAT